ncbi:phage antirepressor N-terminal domain-containing protein [Mycobacterium sp. SM1]|uniref:phage antirepressor N-terminal domain-containing protein n=1 Tax=Mycobacterium sp. SM1 TaxID=2816243 RepID=UPI0035A909F4
MSRQVWPDQRGQPYVALKPLCDAIGVNHATQYRKLNQAPWATVVMMTTVGEDGRSRAMYALHADCIPMPLATLARIARRAAEHPGQLLS